LVNIHSAVNSMKAAKINDFQIAVIVNEIRSAAISEEFSRIQNLISQNPPTHVPGGECFIIMKKRKFLDESET
jgi:5-formaminoimidazole-4-carboxamide-1-beta-D-ribofuranosyl 5'-monophosphate synthetase